MAAKTKKMTFEQTKTPSDALGTLRAHTETYVPKENVNAYERHHKGSVRGGGAMLAGMGAALPALAVMDKYPKVGVPVGVASTAAMVGGAAYGIHHQVQGAKIPQITMYHDPHVNGRVVTHMNEEAFNRYGNKPFTGANAQRIGAEHIKSGGDYYYRKVDGKTQKVHMPHQQRSVNKHPSVHPY